MNKDQLESILKLCTEFAKKNDNIIAMALCGSWARGNANLDSDIDLSIVVKDQLGFKQTYWLEELNLVGINAKLHHYKDEVYGVVWSRHVFLESGIEIEFSFANKSWTNTKPIDKGTLRVVSDGYKILYDPLLLLQDLTNEVNLQTKWI
ncbi:MAG: nucleotidyltransferase domain-containing protein [Bacteroidota bacterium]